MKNTKLCPKCNRTLSIENFYKNGNGRYGTWCKDCCKLDVKIRNLNKPRKYWISDDGTQKLCPKCKRILPIEFFHRDRTHKNGHRSHCKDCMKQELHKYASEHREEAREKARNSWYKHKVKFLEMYGGKCKCCGITDEVFLTIDHINGQEGIHPKECWSKAYKDAINNYDPTKYRILCFNCNMAYRFNRTCPHQIKEK